MGFCEPVSAGSTVETPPEIFDPLHREFGFHRDVCATAENAKLPDYWTIADDALSQRWSGILWMNPPYGRGIGDWVKKAYDAATIGDATVVCLLPVRSDNEWWKYVIKGEVRYLRHRPKFVGMPYNTMFCVCVCIFHAHLDPGAISKIWRFKAPK